MKRKYILMGGCHIILRRRRSAGYNGQHCPKDTDRLHNIGR